MTTYTPDDPLPISTEIGEKPNTISLYNWEKSISAENGSEAEGVVLGGIAARRNDGNLGWLVLNDLAKGIEDNDVERLAWARSRFIFLIQQPLGKIGNYSTNEESKRVALPADFVRQNGYATFDAQLQAAESIIDKLSNSRNPESFEDFNFGTATLGERFRIRRKDDSIELNLSCGNSSEGKYFEIVDFYSSLCSLMGVKDEDLSRAKITGDLKQTVEKSTLDISFDKDKFSRITINLPIINNKI